MPSSPGALIPRIVRQHLQELGLLWRQRSRALRAPDWRLDDVKRLNDRIEPHLDGLRIAAKANPAAITAQLKGDDPSAVSAAAVALLQLQVKEADDEVARALLASEPKQADAIRRALMHGPIDLLEEPLRTAADSAPPHVAAAALEALLYHGRRGVKTDRLAEFVRHEDPAIRAAAWRIVALREGP